jgi:polysaccharide pyruvyl transferase WcaK-like protein
MKKNIYIKGYYGNKNIGDDVFVIIADWIFREPLKSLSIRPIFLGENLPIVSDHSKCLKRRNNLLSRIQEISLFYSVRSIVFFGGSLFTGHTFNKYGAQTFLYKAPFLNKKLLTIGTSIGPFGNDKDYTFTSNFLSGFEHIAVRDYSSLEFSKKMGLSYKTSFIFDLAILINKMLPPKSKLSNFKKTKRIGVSLCHYERFVNGNMSNEIEREKAVDKFLFEIANCKSQEIELVFFVFNGSELNGDYDFSKEYHDKLSKFVNCRIVDYTNDTISFVEEFRDCDYIFGMRLHSAILAYSFGIPFNLVEYHQKCTDFLEVIGYKHEHRFFINNHSKNMMNFEELIDSSRVDENEKPEIFSENMLEQIKLIFEKCFDR